MNQLDKTTRLIKWQHITIKWLLFSLIVAGFLVHGYRFAGSRDHAAAEVFQRGYIQRGEALRDNEQIIRDLNARLSHYEARYGEIDSARKGEGVYINGPQSREW